MNERQKETLCKILLEKVEDYSRSAATAEEVEALAAVAHVLVELSRG